MKAEKPGLHPRNRHHQRYDFANASRLIPSCKAISPCIGVSKPLILLIHWR